MCGKEETDFPEGCMFNGASSSFISLSFGGHWIKEEVEAPSDGELPAGFENILQPN